MAATFAWIILLLWHLVNSNLGIGVVAGLIASMVILFFQRLLVWRESGIICGQWDAFAFDKNDWSKLIPLNGAGRAHIRRASGFFSLCKQPNVLNVKASDILEDGSQRPHSGQVILDQRNCSHGLRTVEYQFPKNDRLELSVQDLRVLNKNTIYITPVGPNSSIYGLHVLIRAKK